MSSKIAVDYTVSYLAGEEKKRPVFLKNLVLKSVLMGESIGDNIVPSYLNGHYFKNKRYLKWVAKPDGYNDAVGLGPLMILAPISDGVMSSIMSEVEIEIPNPDNDNLQISDVQIRQITAEDYADQYIKEHRPELAGRNYSVEATNSTDTAFAIYVAPQGQDAPLLPNPTTGVEEIIVFSKGDAKVGSIGIVAKYTLQSIPPVVQGKVPFIEGTKQNHPGYQTTPYTPSPGFVWDGQEHIETIGQLTKQKYVKNFWMRDADGYTVTFQDGIVNVASNPRERVWKDYRKLDAVHAFDADYPDSITSVYDVERIGYQIDYDTSEWISTVSTNYAGQYGGEDGRYYNMEWEFALITYWFKETGKIEDIALHADIANVYIYPLETGNGVLDAAITEYTTNSVIEAIASPPRPLVINHTSIDELGDKINVGHRKHFINTPWDIIRKAANNYTGDVPNPAYRLVNMAVRKQTSRGVRPVLKEVKEHDDYDKMSYVYYFDGVPINTKRKHLCCYVYEYFRGFTGTGFDVNDRIQEILAYNNKVGAYYDYLEAVEAKAKGTATPAQVALANGPEVLPPDPLSKSKTTEIRWGKDNDFASWIHYSLAMRGEFGSETVITGTQHNPYFNRPAKPREAWITVANHAVKDSSKLIGHVGADVTNFYYQEDANTCRTFSVVNLEFEKWIWRWGYVITTAAEAMEDPDESKFFCLILNQPLKTLGIVPATQVLVESPILEIDVYVQHRQKFGFKQIIGFIISVIVTVFFPPAGAGGYYFGMTGIYGAVVTTAVNMVVGAIIATAAAKVFGGALGAIIGAVATMYTMNVMAGGNMSSFFQYMKDSMGNIQTLAMLTNAVSTAFQEHMVEKVKKMQAQYEDYLKELKTEKNQLNQLMREAGISEGSGISGDDIRKALNNIFWGEAPEDFLRRTQLVGSDMVEEVLNFVNRFSENQLALR